MDFKIFARLFFYGLIIAILSIFPSILLIYLGFFIIPGIVFSVGSLVIWSRFTNKPLKYKFVWIFFATIANFLGAFIAVYLPGKIYLPYVIYAASFGDFSVSLSYLSGMIGTIIGTVITMIFFVYFNNINNRKIKISEFFIGTFLGIALIQTSRFCLQTIYGGRNPSVFKWLEISNNLVVGGDYALFINAIHWAISGVIFWQIGMTIYLGYLMSRSDKNG